MEAFVAGKRKWLVQSLETVRARRRAVAQPQRFESGAKLLYRGRRLLLKVEGAQVKGVEIECRSRFFVRAPAGWSAARREREIAAAFEVWLRERASANIERSAKRYAAALGVEMRTARIGEQKGMWGTCGRDGVVRVNWRLVQAPLAALEYVVAHEVCHLVHRSHGEQFWLTLAGVMPDWRERKAVLEAWETEHRLEGKL